MKRQRPKSPHSQISLLLVCLLLLSGCGRDAAEASPPPSIEPSPSQTQPADTPSPKASTPPEASPSPTPGPTEEVKELRGFPIDNTHDAFEVPTGGRLGTVLVTVEMTIEEGRDPEYTSALSVWDTADLTNPIQTMVQEGATTHTHRLLDANFDGCMDFCYTQYRGAKNEDYCLYIWDEEQGRFSFVESFLGFPGTNIKNKTFDNWSNGSLGAATDKIYRWEDNDLVCARVVELGDYDDNGQELVVRDLTGGELVEVFRAAFPSSAYDASKLWHDLDYHGEGMELLTRQPIDDTHDFFTVPTGGRLGTVVVTVEQQGEETSDGLYRCTFSVWDPAALTEPVQTFEEDARIQLSWHSLIDADFDGHMDFCYAYYSGVANATFGLYLWDEELGQFALTETFFGMDLWADEEARTLETYSRLTAGIVGQDKYRWEDGKLVHFQSIYPDEEWKEYVTCELVNGQWQEVSREPMPIEER